MLDLGSRPPSDVAQQTCSQLRPRSSRCLTSFGFSLNPASTAFQSNALTSGSIDVLDTISVGLYRISASGGLLAPEVERARKNISTAEYPTAGDLPASWRRSGAVRDEAQPAP